MDERHIDKTHGRVQILDGDIFYSPNCSRTLERRPVMNWDNCERDIFLPVYERGCERRRLDVDISSYQAPFPWSTSYGWMSLFPLRPSFDGPVFEQLLIPRPHQFNFDPEERRYSMPQSVSKNWFRIEKQLLNAISLIRSHYHIPLVFPPSPWSLGYLKSHKTISGLQFCMKKAKDWYILWIGLFSYVIAQANTIRKELQKYPGLAKKDWFDVLLEDGAQVEWLEAIEASTICSFSPETLRVGSLLSFPAQEQTQPKPEWFCEHHIPIWYLWNKEMDRNSNIAFLAPLTHQLQDAMSPTIHHALSPKGSPPISKPEWKLFFERREVHTRERIRIETDLQRQQRLSRMRQPPTKTAKVFEWPEDEFGCRYRTGVSVKMREDVLNSYAPDEIRYDPLRNEYDCCEEFGSGFGVAPIDEWNEEDSEDARDNRSLNEVTAAMNFEGTEGEDHDTIDEEAYSPDSLFGTKKEMTINAFVSEVLFISRIFFGYTPDVPIRSPSVSVLKDIPSRERFVRALGIRWSPVPLEAFERVEIQSTADFFSRLQSNGMISADEWDVYRDNRETLYFSDRLSKVRRIQSNLFMFDFGEESTVAWKLAVTSPAHVLTLCRLDARFRERELAEFLWRNGMPFNTLKKASLLRRSPAASHPPLVIPRRSMTHNFSKRDFQAYRDQCHVILKQPRGRAALMRGNYLWRVAVTDVSFDSVLEGPSGWSTNPEEMLVVKISDDNDEYIDDKLTETELRLLEGQYRCPNGKHI
jgi:hypothetical protein